MTKSQVQKNNANLLSERPRLKHEWNHAVGWLNNLRYGIAGQNTQNTSPLRPGEDSLSHPAHLRHNPPAQGPRWHPILAIGEDSVSEQTGVRERAWSSTAPPGEFHTYVPAEESPKEFTIRAVILGALFGLLFGAVTVYVGLRAGLTVSASIPISVLSISILRKMGGYLPPFGRPTILENNIVQTTGSAGESLAAGVMFTIPALIFLGFGSEL